MSEKNDVHDRRPSFGEENLAYDDKSQTTLSQEEIRIEKRTVNSKPPSYSSQLSTRDSFSEDENIVVNNLVATDQDLIKIQEMYDKTKLDKNSNTIPLQEIKQVKKLKSGEFDAVIFKGDFDNKKAMLGKSQGYV